MMKYLQKLGKSLMLPVACLPAAGILMGIGYWISPSVMSGVGDPNVFAFFLVKAARRRTRLSARSTTSLLVSSAV